MDKLTPQLTDIQLKQNIDALTNQKVPTDKIQAYVDNYKKDVSGNYVLKNQPIQSSTVPQQNQQSPGENPSVFNAMKNTGGAFMEGAQQFKRGIDQTTEAATKGDVGLMTRGALNELGGGIGAAFSPLTGTLKTLSEAPGIKQTVDAVKQNIINPAADKISDYKPLQDFMSKYPNADEVVSNLMALGLTLYGAKEAPEIRAGVSQGTEALATGLDKTVGGIKDVASKAESPLFKTPTDTFESSQKSAWNDIQPKATAKTRAAYAKAGNVTEPTLFKGGKLVASPADSKLIDTYSKLYEDGSINDKMTPKEKMTVVEQRAKQLNLDQKEFLANNNKAVRLNVPRDNSGIFDVLDSTAKKSSLPFSKDVTAKGAYDSAIETFKSNLESGKSAGTVKGATTLKNLDEALTKFDKQMESFGAFKKSPTGELTDTAMARQNAIRDIHRVVRDYISDNLPPNSPWKSIRLEESNLYQVKDRISQKVADTVGRSKLKASISRHPVGAAVGKAAVKGAGLGAGLHLLP